jgi:hypothetical protein
MTRKLSISLPDDVAAHLDNVENASAYIAEAIRMRRKSERLEAMLRSHGIYVTREGVERMKARLAENDARRRTRLTGGAA